MDEQKPGGRNVGLSALLGMPRVRCGLRSADFWRGDCAYVTFIWNRFHLLLAVRWRWRLAFVRPAAKPNYHRLYLGPVEIECAFWRPNAGAVRKNRRDENSPEPNEARSADFSARATGCTAPARGNDDA